MSCAVTNEYFISIIMGHTAKAAISVGIVISFFAILCLAILIYLVKKFSDIICHLQYLACESEHESVQLAPIGEERLECNNGEVEKGA